MKATEMPTEAILEELKGCILDLEPPVTSEIPRLMRRMLELREELEVRVGSLQIELEDANNEIDELLDQRED